MRLADAETEEAQLGLAPLLDVVLLLLIFFLVTTSFTRPRIDLELPAAESGEVAEPPRWLVSIDADGALELDGEPIAREALAERLASPDAADADAELVVRADQTVPHGAVVEVLDLARSRGLSHVGIEVASPTGEARP